MKRLIAVFVFTYTGEPHGLRSALGAKLKVQLRHGPVSYDCEVRLDENENDAVKNTEREVIGAQQ
jgi:hypothetical protein